MENCLGILKSITFNVKPLCLHFWQLFKNWATFYFAIWAHCWSSRSKRRKRQKFFKTTIFGCFKNIFRTVFRKLFDFFVTVFKKFRPSKSIFSVGTLRQNERKTKTTATIGISENNKHTDRQRDIISENNKHTDRQRDRIRENHLPSVKGERKKKRDRGSP